MRLLLTFALLPAVASAADPKPKLDLHGDPLPEKALLRLGSVKYRVPNLAGVGFKKTGELVALTQKLELYTFPADGGPKATVTKLLDKPTYTQKQTISANAQFAAAYSQFSRESFVWDISGEKPVRLVDAALKNLLSVALSPDGRWLAAERDNRVGDRSIILYETGTRKSRVLDAPKSKTEVWKFAFSGNGAKLAAFRDTDCLLFDTTTGKELLRVADPGETFLSACLSPDGKQLAVSSTNGGGKDLASVKYFSSENGGTVKGLTGAKGGVERIAYAPDGRSLLLSRPEGVHLWDPVAGKVVREVRVALDDRHPIVASADGTRLALHSSHTVALIDAKTWKLADPDSLTAGHTESIRQIAVSPNGTMIATTATDTRLWDATSGKSLLVVKTRWSPDGNTVAFLPDSKSVVVVGEDQLSLVRFDTATRKEVRKYLVPVELTDSVAVNDVTLSPDGRTVTAALWQAPPKTATLSVHWDTESGEVTSRSEAEPTAFGPTVVRSPDGKWVVEMGTLWPTNEAKAKPTVIAQLHELGSSAGLSGSAFSADSKLLAVPREKSLVIYDIAARKEVRELKCGDVTVSAFTLDRRHVAVLDSSELTLWEVATGRAVYRAACDPIDRFVGGSTIAFTPDGKRLITGHDTTALVWEVSAVIGKK